MKFDPSIHHRRSIRLVNFDYSQEGVYFVTICTQNRENLFGEVIDGDMKINTMGKIVVEELEKSVKIRKEIEIEIFVVMPNHVHIMIRIKEMGSCSHGRGDRPVAPTPGYANGPAKHSIGSFVAGFKSAATKRINEYRHTPGLPVWQRNYYEHIIRDDEEAFRITEYILDNPLKWDLDKYHV